MSIGIGVIGTGVMGAEHARILRHETPGAHLEGSLMPTPLGRRQLPLEQPSFRILIR